MSNFTCKFCGKDTSEVEYDYLVGTSHLACQLAQDMRDVEEYRKDNPIEKCVMCGNDTAFRLNEHVDSRTGYVEGIGQMCQKCYTNGTERRHLTVPTNIIYNTPNDADLGAKIRQLYWENQ